jgi:hypothetical protein
MADVTGPKSRPKNKEAAQRKADLSKAVRVVSKSLGLPAAAFRGPQSLASAVQSLLNERDKMNRGGMMAGKAKAAKKMMRGGVAKKKMMRGGGMAKMAQKKMMRGGMAKKKMMRGGAVKKK